MKNLISNYIVFFILLFASNLMAQATIIGNNQPSSTNLTTSKEVKILSSFQATKQQKRVIRKIKKYVAVRFLGRKKNIAGLIGKTVKVQLNIEQNGTISAISVIEGQGLKINKRVVDLIRKYDKKKPIASTKIEKPAVIQLAISLVSKRYFLD